MTAIHEEPPRTLIDELLEEQRSLTAVERFSRRHEARALPEQAKYYRDLIPLTKPKPGQQFAFAVNLDTCTGCKACVSACHSLNGLEEEETWRDVGLIVGERDEMPYQQTVTTACHHCVEPGCLEGCPVMAYEKDADTGVVHHLDDQCIGCQYCTLKCPYGVPKYSRRLGIVRKCDMCHGRLAAGEAPACVQACPTEAISIRLVDVAEVSAAAQPGTRMIAGAFDSEYTKPTTIYHTGRRHPEAHAADAFQLKLEHAHTPLLVMLVLTQFAVGLFAAAAVVEGRPFVLAAAGFGLLNAGLFAAVFHLGRPLGAWRFFLGLRTSWMSREILAFSVMATVAAPTTALTWFAPDAPLTRFALAVTTVLGLVAVFTSAMIYVDTRRALWNPLESMGRFFGTTVAVALIAWAGWSGRPVDVLPALAGVGGLVAWETVRFRRALSDQASPIHFSALTQQRFLPWLGLVRVVFAVLTMAGIGAGAAIDGSVATGFSAVLTLAAFAVSQTLERLVFFTTVRAPKMPGGIAT